MATADQKKKLMDEAYELLQHGCSIKEVCEQLGVTRSTFRRYREDYRKFQRGDAQALEPKSRAPKRLARLTDQNVVNTIISCARSGSYSSANAIKHHLQSQGIKISTDKIIEILESEGLYGVVMGSNGNKRRGLIV